MKIVLTGGGTGGHFCPLIAVAQRINQIIDEQKILDAKLFYISDTPYDKAALFENGIEYIEITSGKMRLYSSFKNITDMFKLAYGCLQALWKVFLIYPDVVFSKGGYAAIPVLFAARVLRIPVCMHESDITPGRTNIWTGKFAQRISLTYDEAASYFPAEKTAAVGQPIRLELKEKATHGVFEFFELNSTLPTIFVTGGSSGAEVINELILKALPELLKKYQVIHQAGKANFEQVKGQASIIMERNPLIARYKCYGYMSSLEFKMAAGTAAIIVTRAGSTLFEIASWGIPAIVIPITDSNGDHQRKNAFSFARRGAAHVMEEKNLSVSVLLEEVDNILSNKARYEAMSESGKKVAGIDDPAYKIAGELITIALSHEE